MFEVTHPTALLQWQLTAYTGKDDIGQDQAGPQEMGTWENDYQPVEDSLAAALPELQQEELLRGGPAVTLHQRGSMHTCWKGVSAGTSSYQ